MGKIFEEQEDIDIIREELEEKIEGLENMVGVV